MEWLIIDTTIIRAHPCAAGVLKTSGRQASQALGRSRGGFPIKIHVAIDGLGNPLRFRLTVTCAEALIDGYSSKYVIADTSYDAMAFIESITRMGAVSVIPPVPIAVIHACIERDIWWNVLSTKSSTIAVSSLDLIS